MKKIINIDFDKIYNSEKSLSNESHTNRLLELNESLEFENALKRIGIKTNINEVLDGFFLLEFEEQERKVLREKMEKTKEFNDNKKEYKL